MVKINKLLGFVIFGLLCMFSSYGAEWDYINMSYNISPEISGITDINWDGTNWWAIDGTGGIIYKYNSTWGYTGTSYNVSSQLFNPESIYWDGTNWWLVGINNDNVYKYNSTWGYTGTSYDVSSQFTNSLQAIDFDGEFFWLADTDNVYKYNLTFAYQSETYDLGNIAIEEIYFYNNFWWVSMNLADSIRKYNSSWSIIDTYAIYNEDTTPQGIEYYNTNWYLAGATNDNIYLYSAIPSINSLNITPISPNYLNNLTFVNSTNSDFNITSYSWKWYKNNIEQTTFENQSTISYLNTTINDSWLVSLRVYDGVEWSDWLNSSAVIIADNISPILSSDSLSSNSGTDDAQFTIYVNVTDESNFSSIQVQVTDPNSIATNFSMSLVSGDQYSKVYTPSTDGVYSFKFYAEDIWSNIANLTSSLTYTESTSEAPAGGGGGGGGTTVITLDDDSDKPFCDVQLNLEQIFLTENYLLEELRITNTAGKLISGLKYTFEHIQGDETLSNQLRVTNTPELIETGFTEQIGVKILSLFLQTGSSEAQLIISSTECKSFIIPVFVEIEEEQALRSTFEELFSSNFLGLIGELSNENILSNIFDFEIQNEKIKKLDSISGFWILSLIIIVILLFPTPTELSRSPNLILDIGLRLIIFIILSVVVLIVLWLGYQSYVV